MWQRFLIRFDWPIYRVRRWFGDIPMKIAWMLPRKVALWAFIRVYSAGVDGPGPDYERAYRAWENGAGR